MRGLPAPDARRASAWFGPPSRARDPLADRVAGSLLVLGHYADVTTPALYGRDINLYWDVRYMPDVAAMIARAAPLWLIVCVAAAVVAVVALAVPAVPLGDRPRRRCRRRAPSGRVAIAVVASVMLVCVFIAPAARRARRRRADRSPTPVTQTYARQAAADRRRAQRVAHARRRARRWTPTWRWCRTPTSS